MRLSYFAILLANLDVLIMVRHQRIIAGTASKANPYVTITSGVKIVMPAKKLAVTKFFWYLWKNETSPNIKPVITA